MDDTVLLAESKEELQELVEVRAGESEEKGLNFKLQENC